mmetsp:Transcript_2118/g.4847  ORF Transcript_2118/g.4847 Transcript_2118/m.4847 type:complete len:200 (-) Transcript_2118:451-1050(-)
MVHEGHLGLLPRHTFQAVPQAPLLFRIPVEDPGRLRLVAVTNGRLLPECPELSASPARQLLLLLRKGLISPLEVSVQIIMHRGHSRHVRATARQCRQDGTLCLRRVVVHQQGSLLPGRRPQDSGGSHNALHVWLDAEGHHDAEDSDQDVIDAGKEIQAKEALGPHQRALVKIEEASTPKCGKELALFVQPGLRTRDGLR